MLSLKMESASLEPEPAPGADVHPAEFSASVFPHLLRHMMGKEHPVEVGRVGFQEERAVETEDGDPAFVRDVIGGVLVRDRVHLLDGRVLRWGVVAP